MLYEHTLSLSLHTSCIALQSAHSHGYFNRDVRPENILVARETQKIYLVDWGSAASRSDFPLPFEGTVHYSAARILDQLIAKSQAVIFTCADDLESLVCSAFCLCHPALQAQLHSISKAEVNQIQERWQHTAWQQRSCWLEAVEVAQQNDYEGVALRLRKLMQ